MKLKPEYYKINGIHSIYWRTKRKLVGFFWECQPPIWWLPKIEVIDGAFRIGWLLVAVGLMCHPRKLV